MKTRKVDCKKHTEYGRHKSDSLCPYAENEIHPQHTPTPWKVDRWHDKSNGSKGISIISSNTRAVANMVMQIQDNEMANAAFIVRAVNSHEELLDLVKQIYAFTKQGMSLSGSAYIGDDETTVNQMLQYAIAKAEQV